MKFITIPENEYNRIMKSGLVDELDNKIEYINDSNKRLVEQITQTMDEKSRAMLELNEIKSTWYYKLFGGST